ncbi:zinc finger CCCH domain-containing protein 32-like [Forsythia ovata]|uniref:Zinc finger CCCH domain-containing protein 32-like n=1 Tax=Forsythia ovata TaxID=205694 RepID=A0ABD1WFW2_9LAMI
MLKYQSLSAPSEQYDSTSTTYRVARPPLLPGSYVPGAYAPMLLHPGVVPMPNWNPYSGPVSPAPSPGAQPSVGAASEIIQEHEADTTTRTRGQEHFDLQKSN